MRKPTLALSTARTMVRQAPRSAVHCFCLKLFPEQRKVIILCRGMNFRICRGTARRAPTWLFPETEFGATFLNFLPFFTLKFCAFFYFVGARQYVEISDLLGHGNTLKFRICRGTARRAPTLILAFFYFETLKLWNFETLKLWNFLYFNTLILWNTPQQS